MPLAISITRRQALQLRAVMRRAFGNRGPGPALGFIADAEGLHVRARFADAAVEYRAPGERPTETLWLPFQFLADCEGKKDEPIELTAADKGRVTAQWRDGSVPQIVSYECEPPADADKFPGVPEAFAENPPRLLQSLADAGESCDPDSIRYSLACLQLRGQQGSIGATDGRHLLVQSGYTFPWEGDILIPRSKVFSSSELAGDHPVLVGKAEDNVAFRTGPWTIWLAINKDGRFPDLSRHIPQPAGATARCTLSATDAAFLAQSLPSLPSDDAYNFPVTLDLNGQVAIRAKAVDQAKPTEIVLTGSSWSGEPVRLNMNRKFLARALKLGFYDLLVYGDKAPVVCHDEHRHFVWATLDPESAIPPATDAIRIESPSAEPQLGVTLEADDVAERMFRSWAQLVDEEKMAFDSPEAEQAMRQQAADLVRAYLAYPGPAARRAGRPRVDRPGRLHQDPRQAARQAGLRRLRRGHLR
jgi:hypothetical protein